MTFDVKPHHKRILKLASEGNPNNASVASYKKLLSYRECLAQGWIEELLKVGGNGSYFKITLVGIAARDRPKVKSIANPRRLAMAAPRLSPLPVRISPSSENR